MNGRKISGMNFDVSIGGKMLHVESATVSISDETAVAYTRGVPNGFTDGKVGAEVEYELDSENFKLLSSAARDAGSWRDLKPHDVLFYASVGSDEEERIEAFGVKFMLEEVLNISPDSSDKTKRKIKGLVTSPNFVRINGVPYLSKNDTRGLLN